MAVNMWTFTWIMHEMGYRVQHGELVTAMLLKPIHPIHSDIADNIGYKTLTLFVLIPSAAVLCFLFKPTFDLEVISVLCFVFSLVLRVPPQILRRVGTIPCCVLDNPERGGQSDVLLFRPFSLGQNRAAGSAARMGADGRGRTPV